MDVDSEQDQELQSGGAGMRRKPRNDRRFCPSRGGVKDKCKADWNYHVVLAVPSPAKFDMTATLGGREASRR